MSTPILSLRAAHQAVSQELFDEFVEHSSNEPARDFLTEKFKGLPVDLHLPQFRPGNVLAEPFSRGTGNGALATRIHPTPMTREQRQELSFSGVTSLFSWLDLASGLRISMVDPQDLEGQLGCMVVDFGLFALNVDFCKPLGCAFGPAMHLVDRKFLPGWSDTAEAVFAGGWSDDEANKAENMSGSASHGYSRQDDSQRQRIEGLVSLARIPSIAFAILIERACNSDSRFQFQNAQGQWNDFYPMRNDALSLEGAGFLLRNHNADPLAVRVLDHQGMAANESRSFVGATPASPSHKKGDLATLVWGVVEWMNGEFTGAASRSVSGAEAFRQVQKNWQSFDLPDVSKLNFDSAEAKKPDSLKNNDENKLRVAVDLEEAAERWKESQKSE